MLGQGLIFGLSRAYNPIIIKNGSYYVKNQTKN